MTPLGMIVPSGALIIPPNAYAGLNKINPQTKPKSKKTTNQTETHRAGDWVCILCHNLNYSFRKVCNRCQVQTKRQNLIQSLSLLGKSFPNEVDDEQENQAENILMNSQAQVFPGTCQFEPDSKLCMQVPQLQTQLSSASTCSGARLKKLSQPHYKTSPQISDESKPSSENDPSEVEGSYLCNQQIFSSSGKENLAEKAIGSHEKRTTLSLPSSFDSQMKQRIALTERKKTSPPGLEEEDQELEAFGYNTYVSSSFPGFYERADPQNSKTYSLFQSSVKNCQSDVHKRLANESTEVAEAEEKLRPGESDIALLKNLDYVFED